MTIEVVSNISDLNQSYPAPGDDPSEGDDHIRNIKKALLADLPNITGPVTATQSQLNSIGLFQISTATASGVATVDFTSGLTSAYDEYELHIVNAVPATTSVTAKLLTTSDGVTWDTTGYTGTLVNNSAATVASPTFIGLSASSAVTNTASDGGVCAVVKLFSPSNTTASKMVFVNATAAATSVMGGMARATTSAITGLRFLFSSGNVASGLFKLYGVRK
jgi:hypothetical protein